MVSSGQTMFQTHPAIVLLPNPDIVSTGIGVVRSLGREGVPVVTVSSEHRPKSAFSRYVWAHYVVPDPATDPTGFADELCRLGQSMNLAPVLFVTTDELVMQVNLLQERLRPYFLYNYLKPSAVRKCIDKLAMFQAAKACGVPVPKTVLVRATDPNHRVLQHLAPPYAVKPASWVQQDGGTVRRSTVFLEEFDQKAFSVTDLNELSALLSRAAARNCDVVVQEQVQGGCDRIYGVSLYADANHNTLALFTGQKTRQYPADFGTGCCITPVRNEVIAGLSRRLVKEIEFSGIAEIEFKCDPRDGQFKLIEINPRPGTWITVAPVNGVNTPLVAYANLTGVPHPPCGAQSDERVWVDGWLDFLYFVSSRRRDTGQPALSWREWRNSLGYRPEAAYLSWDDPKPGIIQGLAIAQLVTRAAIRRALCKVH
ncbi:MAG: carboxylate--amine ligase [Candidatus Zipacnadales bacterium]